MRKRKSLLQGNSKDQRAAGLGGAVAAWVGVFAMVALALLPVIGGRLALIPSEAGARADAAPEPVATETTSEIVSPFGPWDDTGRAQASLAGIRLLGLRVSADALRSGAVFMLADGIERAFIIGDEIAPGVHLSAVGAHDVVLSVRGGQMHMLVLEQGERRFIDTANVPARPQANVASPGENTSASAWLAMTLSRPEESMGPSPGWRVRPPLPPAAAQVGLQVGDLITAINGASPSDARAAGAAAQGQLIQLSVTRSTGERVTLWFPSPAAPTGPASTAP